MNHPPLQLYLLAHPRSTTGRRTATALMDRFVDPPASGGLRIPVRLTPDLQDGQPPSLEKKGGLDLEAAQHTLVVILADGEMARTQGPNATGRDWQAWIDACLARAPLGSSSHHVMLVALDEYAYRLAPTQHILSMPLAEQTVAAKERRLTDISFHIAARAIQLLEHGRIEEISHGQCKAPVRLFISHAKADLSKEKDDPAHQTMKELVTLPIDHWFDARNIAPGQAFADAIQGGIRDCSIFLAFHTDHYGSRPWCRREVLEAKKMGAHLLVVDALTGAEPRMFPYLGNVPSIRWQYGNDPAVEAHRVVERAVLEALRFKHNRALMELHADAGHVCLAEAPEAVTLAFEHPDGATPKTFLYPDPPLGREELEVLGSLRPRARFLTPITMLAERFRTNTPVVVGVSISAPDSQDLERYGLSAAHLATLSDEVHLYLLAAGLRIAYGGALQGKFDKADNFTLRMVELVRGYSPLYRASLGEHPLAPILNFPPWPLVLNYGLDEWNLSEEEIQFAACASPSLPWETDTLFPLVDGKRDLFSKTLTPSQRYAWARGLTAMRQQMTRETRARVVVGGKLIGFQGLLPGVVEEAWCSLAARHPLFLIGAFGGAAQAVSDVLMGQEREEFSEMFQKAHVPDYEAGVALYGKQGEPFVSMAQMAREMAQYRQHGLARALNNGLDDAENEALIQEADPSRIAWLILTGLSQMGLLGEAKQGG